MPTSARWEVTNSPKISVKSVYPAGGQSRPPLQGELRLVVGADDSVGPLGSHEFAEDSRKVRCILPGRCVPASGRATSVTLLRRERLWPASTPTKLISIAPEDLSCFKYRGKDPRKPKRFSWSVQGDSGGKSKSPPARFLLEKQKKMLKGSCKFAEVFQPSCGFIICVIDPKIYSRPGVLGREHTCFVVPPKFGGFETPPSCADKRAAQSPAISAQSALYACSADVLPGAAAKTSQRHGLLSGQAGNRYCFRVVAKFKVIGSSSCSSSSYANPDRRAAIRGSAFQPRPDSSRTGRWTSRTGAACA